MKYIVVKEAWGWQIKEFNGKPRSSLLLQHTGTSDPGGLPDQIAALGKGLFSRVSKGFRTF